MTNAKFKALRSALDAFIAIQQQLSLLIFADEGLVEAVHQVVQKTNKRVSGVLPLFNRDAYISSSSVKIQGLRAYVTTAVSFLSVAIEDEGSIAAEHLLDFTYVGSSKLRSLLQRDYRELLRALNSKCWKAAVVLSGGLIEALLMDQLHRVAQTAHTALSAPKKNPDILTWRFIDLINVAVEVGIVSKGAEKLSHSVRDYRNLVHLHKELEDALGADEHEAKIAFNVLNLIDRDLQP